MTAQVSHTLRAVLLGTGGWSKVLAAAAKGSRLELAYCWGRTPERVHAFTEVTGLAGVTELEHVWRDADIEAVVIAVPNNFHRKFATLAAVNRKHIFIEKPIAHNLEDGLAMVDLARDHGIHLVVGHCARMLPGNRFIARAVRNGELGRVTHVEATFANDRGLTLMPNDWRWYRANAPGGPLSQIAIHQFDTMRSIGGDLAAVSAQSARLSSVGAEVEDQWVVSVRFSDGKLGSLVTSWTSPGLYSVRATGEHASLFYEVNQALWSKPDRLHEEAVLERQARGEGPGTRKRLPVVESNMLRDELELFADAVYQERPCELSGENGCHALAAVDASIVSMKRGGEAVHLDEVMDAARAQLVRERK